VASSIVAAGDTLMLGQSFSFSSDLKSKKEKMA